MGRHTHKVLLAENGKAQATLVIGRDAPPFYRWVAGEMQRYLRQLSGAEFPIATSAECAEMPGTRILVGGPKANDLTAAAQQQGKIAFSNLKQDGFLLKHIELEDGDALIVAGSDERSTMYAAYDLLERLGVAFQFTGDIIPERKPDLSLPALDVRQEPEIKYRGFHLRHFVMPWMGLDDFGRLVDQLAKLKCNYLEFFWYVGGPWVEYGYRGEQALIGDLYTRESGYTAWRIDTATFTTADVAIGKEHFGGGRACAPEFQSCNTPDEAYRSARQLLREMIAYAHERKLEIWLGIGDCPAVPPNLGRHTSQGEWSPFGYVIAPGDPAGVEIWTATLKSMVETYPEADGYWLWLAETYHRFQDPDTAEALKPYDGLRHLIPGPAELVCMGYDQYVEHLPEEELITGDLSLLHYGKEVVEAVRRECPEARLGVSVLGRSYLFPALDAVLPKDVPLQSMEAAICWNRSSRVPMQNLSLSGRETFLIPRLDDDCNEFAMQFNVGLYHHDRVLAGSREYGVSGIAPQTGKLRGLEQNARYIADGCWHTTMSPNEFYAGYVRSIFGPRAADLLSTAYRLLEENEMFLGLEVDAKEGGVCFQGLSNFLNYADSQDIRWLRQFGQQRWPFDGPQFADWDVRQPEEPVRLRQMRYRLRRFREGIARLEQALDYLNQALTLVAPGARQELEYVIWKTHAFILHLQACCGIMEGFLAYDAAFRARLAGDEEGMSQRFDACEAWFKRACALAEETARLVARHCADPTERHILFRYNVRQVLPLREFQRFIHNVVSFHQGVPYWEPVNWHIIAPPSIAGL